MLQHVCLEGHFSHEIKMKVLILLCNICMRVVKQRIVLSVGNHRNMQKSEWFLFLKICLFERQTEILRDIPYLVVHALDACGRRSWVRPKEPEVQVSYVVSRTYLSRSKVHLAGVRTGTQTQTPSRGTDTPATP